jgi:hypothetical protein
MELVMPLPSGRVIHPAWSQHHRSTATGTMTAACTITRRTGTGTTSPDGTYTPPAPATIYTGPCRVTAPPFSREQRLTGEEAQITTRRYSVFVEWDAAEFQVGDLITITSSVDLRLVGKAFRLIDILHGSEQWQRNLLGEEIEGRVTG